MTSVVYQTQEPATPPKGLQVQTRTSTDGNEVQAVYLDGVNPVRIEDVHGHVANVQQISATMDGDEYGVITNAVIHGKSTAGGGAWVDVKVSPSGAVQVGGELDGIAGTVATTRADDFYNDAFQRMRTSETDQRFDAEFLYDLQPMLFERIGNGTFTHNLPSRDVTLGITGTAVTDSAMLVQHWYNPYTPGNSQFIAITGTLNGANLAGTASVFLRSAVTGTVAEEVINQSSWTAASTDTDWNNSHIFLFDFQSLKVGRIRYAIDTAGVAIQVAEIKNDSERATGYWQFANLPTFWRNYNTTDATVTEIGYGDTDNAIGFRYSSALDASQTCRAICVTVKSEGGGDLLNMPGFPFGWSNGATLKTVSNTLVPVLSIQVKPEFSTSDTVNRGLVLPTALSFQTDQPIYYEILLNASLTGPSWISSSTDSIVNYDVTASAVSGGRKIGCGYAGSGGTRAAATQTGFTGKVPLCVNYAGAVGDTLTVAAIRTAVSNASSGAALEWKEIR